MKYVVVSAKKMPGGSRVMCAACPKEEAEETLKRLEVHPNTKDYGPFEVMTAADAEKKKLYGD